MADNSNVSLEAVLKTVMARIHHHLKVSETAKHETEIGSETEEVKEVMPTVALPTFVCQSSPVPPQFIRFGPTGA